MRHSAESRCSGELGRLVGVSDQGTAGGDELPDPTTIAELLRLSDLIRGPCIRSAIDVLGLPAGSRGLDAGCGIGSHTLLLTEAVAPGGHVMGLDHSPELLGRARQAAKDSALSGQVSFCQADVNNLPFDPGVFDWVWSVDCVGFIPGESLRLVRELARVVKPGGTVAFLVWSSQQLLPGHPLLEARLNATSLGIAPFSEGKEPDSHFLRALGWLRQAGLEEPTVRTFVCDAHAPLSDEVRHALSSLIGMRWGEPRSELTQDEWNDYQRLRRRDTSESIVDRSDYYAFFTYSMFWGRVGRRSQTRGGL